MLVHSFIPFLHLLRTGVSFEKCFAKLYDVGHGCPTCGQHAAPEVLLIGPRCISWQANLSNF